MPCTCFLAAKTQECKIIVMRSLDSMRLQSQIQTLKICLGKHILYALFFYNFNHIKPIKQFQNWIFMFLSTFNLECCLLNLRQFIRQEPELLKNDAVPQHCYKK
jgi:hypothetical protein